MAEARSILITGASSGIGADAAMTFAQRGWQVFATARNDADLARLRAHGLNALYLDYGDEASIHAAADAVFDATGGRLDALYNNGSYAQVGAIEDLSTDALRRQFETGVFGWHTLTRRAIPVMRQQGHGRIVQCSSVLGFVAAKYRGAYVGSKYALEGMTDTLRLELAGTGIHVVLIEPGPITTAFTASALANIDGTIDIASSPYQADYRSQIAAAAAKSGRRSMFQRGPDAVTAALIHAVESPRPRIRYRVTPATKIVAVARRLLPARLLDRVLAMNSDAGTCTAANAYFDLNKENRSMSLLSERQTVPAWNTPRSILRLVIALVICFAAAGLGSLMTTPNIPTWYATLAKPPFNPPNWLFAPVWTILFAMMAIGLWRVWNRGQDDALRRAKIVFAVQIVLNVLWSGAFFALHQPLLGLVVIFMLILAIITTIAAFATIDRLAAWLYVPYLAWVSFATILNASIWLLN